MEEGGWERGRERGCLVWRFASSVEPSSSSSNLEAGSVEQGKAKRVRIGRDSGRVAGLESDGVGGMDFEGF